jgi:hypothetical protein
MPPGNAQSKAATSVASTWGRLEPAAAAAWACQFAEGAARENALRNVVSAWAPSDLTGAATFLQGLPAGASRDAAVSSYISGVAPVAAELAAPWVSRISDPNQLYTQAATVARAWLQSDPAAAAAWIAQLNLPEDRRQNLLKLNSAAGGSSTRVPSATSGKAGGL